MHDSWSLERLHELEGLHHLGDVVPVDRAEIAKAELLEQHPRGPEVFDALLEGLGEVHQLLSPDEVGGRFDQSLHPLADAHGNGAGDDRAEVPVDGADVGGNRHAVVVQDHDDVAPRVPRVVHRFVG